MGISKKVFFVLCLFFVQEIGAQQQFGLSLYNQLMGIYNPAAIPSEYTNDQHNLIVGVNARNQWTNLSSGPSTQSVSLEYISDTDNRFNLLMGGYILNDKVGPVSTTGAYLKLASIMSSYNPEVGGFSLGLQLGMTQYRIETERLREKYPDDILTYTNQQLIKPALSIGASYYVKLNSSFLKGSNLNTGISLAQLGFNTLEFNDKFEKFSIFTDPHLYGYAKLYKPLSNNRAWELNSWMRYVPNAPFNFDIHYLFHVNEVFWLEIGGNSSGMGHVGFGFKLRDFFNGNDNQLQFNYAYLPSLFNFGTIFGSTHEVGMKFSFRKE